MRHRIALTILILLTLLTTSLSVAYAHSSSYCGHSYESGWLENTVFVRHYYAGGHMHEYRHERPSAGGFWITTHYETRACPH